MKLFFQVWVSDAALEGKEGERSLVTRVSGLMLFLLFFKAWSGFKKGFIPLLRLSYELGVGNTEPECRASSGEWWGGAGSAMLGGGHGVFVLVTGCTRAWANWAGLCQHNLFLHLEMSELSSFGFLGRLPFAFLPASEQKPSSSCAKCLYVFPLSWGILSVEGLRKILLIFLKCGAN